jgi:predicted aspartyl protease
MVDDDGVPIILLEIGDQTQAMIIDSGFNGDLELPESFRQALNSRFLGSYPSSLAGGVSIEEDVFGVTLTFDGHIVDAEATFTTEPLGLIGTHLLRDYRLEIDFVEQTLLITRVNETSI